MKLQELTRRRGYNLAIKNPSDVFMSQVSFVAYGNGMIIVLDHIPMYKTLHLMKLIQYTPTSININNSIDQQIIIQPNKPIIATTRT